MQKIFRKESLERLASPEQLDRLLVIIRVPGWIALFALVIIILAILFWSLFGQLSTTTSGLGIFFDPRSIELIQSDVDGVVKKVSVEEGDSVKKGDPLLIMDSVVVYAPNDGRVLSIDVLRGESVGVGKNLFWFQTVRKGDEKEQIFGFFSIAKGDQIHPGMQAQITFDSVRTEIYGKMKGIVKEVLPFAANPQGNILRSIPSQPLREYLSKEGATVVVVIEPTLDPQTPSGYKWTIKEGPPYRIHVDSVAQVKVFLDERRPITYLIPIGVE